MMRKAGIIAFVCLAGLPLFAGYNYQATLTVSGYSGSTTLSGFPVLVRISPDTISGFSYDKLTDPDNGTDIRFLDNAGNVLPHEIDTWDKTGTSLVWVRIPSLTGKTTSFRFQLGTSDTITPASSRNVWCDSNGGYYAGVWHMSEAISADEAATTASLDSAKYSPSLDMDAAPHGSQMSEMTNDLAVVGSGRFINTVLNAGKNYLQTSDFSSLALGNSFTASGWFRLDSFDGGQKGLFATAQNWYSSWDKGWFVWAQNIYGLTFYARNPSGTSALSKNFVVGETFHFAVTVEPQDGGKSLVKLYFNGARKGDDTTIEGVLSEGVNGFTIGALAGGYGPLSGTVDEVRLLSKPGSTDWVKAEYDTASSATFVTAEPVIPIGGGAITVTAQPEELGTVDPAYGSVFLSPGQSRLFFAPDEEQFASAMLKFRFEGWSLYEVDMASGTETLLDSATTNAYLCVGTDSVRRFVWKVRRIHPVALSADKATNFTIDGQPADAGVNWVPEGTSVLFGAGSENTVILEWSGDIGTANPYAPTVSIAVNGPMSLAAKMRTIRHVKTSGSDITGDGTHAKPWQTINHAIAGADPLDEIHIAGGLYEEAVVNDVDNGGKQGLIFRGGYDADWNRDLAGSPTIIRPPSTDLMAMTLTGVYTNIVEGLVVTGGKSGLVCTKSGFNRFSRIIATNNTSSAWGEGRGIGFASDYKRFNVYSETIIDNSYVADNKTGIANGDGNDKMKVYLVNDTICRNSDTGVTGSYSETYFCNCIVSGNANYGMALNFGSSYLYDSCFYGTTTADVFAQPGDGDKANWWGRFNLRYRAGTIRLDPRLGADGRPLADSLTLKRGTARFADKVSDQTDVLGQPWNGSWDMGCFKSAYPIADTVRYADVYVAEDGDDANTGSTPQDPVRTLALGVFRTATNGTCHLGPGSFTAPAVLDKDGVTLVGAGVQKTTVVGLAGRNDSDLVVVANGVTVRDLQCDNGREGVTVAAVSVATNTMIRDCRFVNQRVAGVRKHNEDGAVAETTPFRVSHCTFTNCCWGIYCSGAKLFADNSLFTFNGLTDFDQSGAVCTGSSFGSHAPYQLSQCTLVDNVCGIYSGRSFNGCLTDRCAYNCILSGNRYGYKSTDVGSVLFGRFYNCLFDNDTNFGNEPQLNENPVYAAPKFIVRDGVWYQLSIGSPACGSGYRLSGIPDLPSEVWTDLLGRPVRPARRPDLGCYQLKLGLMIMFN